MNLGDIFEKDYYFEFEPRKNYETGKVAHKLPRGTNEPLRFTIEEMYLLRQFFKEYGSDALFPVFLFCATQDRFYGQLDTVLSRRVIF